MTTDASPAAKVAAQEAEVARLRHDLELAQAVLQGMKAMLPPVGAPAAPTMSSQSDVWERGLKRLVPPSKGRQPGAISQQWRNTLCRLLITLPDGFTDDEAAAAAISEGLPNVRPKDAADRLNSYLAHEYVERLATGKWRITDLVPRKFPNTLKHQRDALRIRAPTGEPVEAP
jgi:hypothetical protein